MADRNKKKSLLEKSSIIKGVMFSPVGLVFFVYLLQGILVNLGHPVTPAFVNSLGIPSVYFGFYFSAMSLGILIGAPIWGSLADITQKRYYIFFGLLLYSGGQILFGYGSNKDIMIIYRFMSGFGISASITLLMSHLIESSPKEFRKVYLGWSQGLKVIATSIGYFIGGTLSVHVFFTSRLHTDKYHNIFLIQAILVALLACVLVFVIKDKKKEVTSDMNSSEKKGFIQSISSIKTVKKELLLFLIALTFISVGATIVTKFIEVYMTDAGLNPGDIGLFGLVQGIVAFVTMVFIIPVVVKVKDDIKVMLFIQILSAVIIFIVFRQVSIMIMLYSLYMFYIVLKTVFTPMEQDFIASFSNGEKYGLILGIRQSFLSMGLVIGPLIGGALYSKVPRYAFDFSVLMFLIGFLLIFIVGRLLKKKAKKIV